MPERLLPTGRHALVTHPTNAALPAYILHDQWRTSPGGNRVDENRIRVALNDQGYHVAYFGDRDCVLPPVAEASPYPTVSTGGTSTWSFAPDAFFAPDPAVEDAVRVAVQRQRERQREREQYAAQQRMYERYAGYTAGGYVSPPSQAMWPGIQEGALDRGSRVHLAIADEVQYHHTPNPAANDNGNGNQSDWSRMQEAITQATRRRGGRDRNRTP